MLVSAGEMRSEIKPLGFSLMTIVGPLSLVVCSAPFSVYGLFHVSNRHFGDVSDVVTCDIIKSKVSHTTVSRWRRALSPLLYILLYL